MVECPLDYSFCDRTVTVYHPEKNKILRTVVENCYFHMNDTVQTQVTGSRKKREFFLVMPGTEQRLFPGDRMLAGEGPQVRLDQWPAFVPERVEGLVQVGSVTPCFWQGTMCHVEAKEET